MEHFNPLLLHHTPAKFITVGEIMLRLTRRTTKSSVWLPTLSQLWRQRGQHCAGSGKPGCGQHVLQRGAQQLSGQKCSALAALQRCALHPDDPLHAGGNPVAPSGHLLPGNGLRHPPPKVIYDRKHSAITEYDFSDVDLDALLDGFDWLHLSGITPALGPNCRDAYMMAC